VQQMNTDKKSCFKHATISVQAYLILQLIKYVITSSRR